MDQKKATTPAEKTLADLKQRFGDEILLSPEDIAKVLRTSVAVQANMRSKGTFPLPIIRMGNRVGVNIYQLADYLNGNVIDLELDDPKMIVALPPSSATPPSTPQPTPKKKIPRTKTQNAVEEDWRIGFQQSIQFQVAVFAAIEKLDLEESVSAKDEQTGGRNSPF